MKELFRRLTALTLALALSLSLAIPALAAETGGDAPGKPFSLSDIARIAKDLADENTVSKTAQNAAATALQYGGASQIAWALWRDGQVLQGGLADPKRETRPETPPESAVYGIGSVSKIYTTAAVLQLAEQGKLSLDAPVTKYLPAFKMADERYRQITVRMLLNHSSGLMGSSMSSGLLFDDPSTTAADTLLQRLASQRLKADPGAYSVYCNDGFTLAELVVEAVSRQDFMTYVRRHLLEPAGLTDTFAPGDAFTGRAEIYSGGDPRPLPMDCLGIVGTGGIYATAADLAAFGGALTGTALLKPASLDAMAAPEYARGLWPKEDPLEAPDALAYGLGWDSVAWFPFCQNGITALVKGGDTQYYHAGLVVLPEYHMAAAVLSVGGVSTYNELAASQILIAALKGRGIAVDETAPALPAAEPAAMPRELLRYAGYYGSLLAYKIDLTEEGLLTMSFLGMETPAQTFTYHNDGSFRDASGTALLRFTEESGGGIYLYQRAFAMLPGLGGLGTSNYAAMKLPENPISPELQKAWDDLLDGADILPMNERYSSQVYLAMSAAGQAQAAASGEGVPGYAGTLRIVDDAHARYVVQIPGNVGRDGYDLELRRDRKGALWMYQSNGSVYMETAAAPELTPKNNTASAVIRPNGYAQWYRTGKAAAGKTVTVELPGNAGFWAYDKDWKLTASSVLWGDTEAKLTEGGWLVLAGDPGVRFRLSFR